MLFSTLATSSLMILSSLVAMEPPETNSNDQIGRVSHVTLYRNQALVTRTLAIAGEAGGSEVVIGDLPENIVPDSLFAEGSQDIEIRAVQFRTRAVGESPREEVRQLQEQITTVQDKIALNAKNTEISVRQVQYLDQLEGFVAPTATTELSQGVLNAEALERMTRFSFEQREAIAARQIELAKEKRQLDEELNLLQRQLNEITHSATKTVREAVLFVSKSTDAGEEVRLNYLVNNCGWSPTYTIRSTEDRQQAKLDYNALIYQMSGEDWQGVSLTLSTASPALSAAGPGLAPLRVSLTMEAQQQQQGGQQMDFKNLTLGQVEEIVGKQQRAAGANRYATNFQDYNESSWTLNNAADEFACVELIGDSSVVANLQAEMQQMLDEPSLTYRLASGVSLNSRSSRQMVRIVTSDLPSTFYHVATPVLTSFVYREAEITNNSSEDLLGGPITVYLDDRFVGRGEIPTVARGQTFVVGFGADPQLRTRRELAEKQDGINGGNRELKFDYRLVIENFKAAPAEIRLMDRMPTAAGNAEIRVTQRDFSANLSDDEIYQRLEKPEGILRWDVEVPAGATNTDSFVVNYSYTVEYDRNYVVSLPATYNQQKQEFERLQRVRTVR